MFQFIHELPDQTPNYLAILLFAFIIIVTWMLPKKYIYKGIDDHSPLKDLRIWATILLVLQSFLYVIF